MITIKKLKTKTEPAKYQLHLDDEVFNSGRRTRKKNDRLTLYVPKNLQLEVEVKDSELINKIAEHRFDELPSELHDLMFLSDQFSIDGNLIEPIDYFYLQRRGHAFNIGCAIRANHHEWSAPFTTAEFIVEYYKRVRLVFPTEFDNDESLVTISLLVKDLGLTIKSELIAVQAKLQSIYDQTTAFVESAQRDSVAVFFDFPESIRVPCEQYLLYFGQFLKDLGVDADTALSHEAGQVLFTVTPTDQKEALDKIQTALDVYLKLYANPVADNISESIEVQRLEANILRLRSDLKLAAAELQAKDTTIQAQNLIIEVQKGLLNGEILASSVKDVTPAPEEKEDVIPGILALSTYEDKGVRVNLGELLRRLKTFFSDR